MSKRTDFYVNPFFVIKLFLSFHRRKRKKKERKGAIKIVRVHRYRLKPLQHNLTLKTEGTGCCMVNGSVKATSLNS